MTVEIRKPYVAKAHYYLARCKRCGGRSRLSLAPKVTTVYAGYGRTERRYDYELPNGAKLQGGYDKLHPTCLCGRVVEFKRVVGVFNDKKECSPKCMAAHGPSCECHCAGENHGASWG